MRGRKAKTDLIEMNKEKIIKICQI